MSIYNFAKDNVSDDAHTEMRLKDRRKDDNLKEPEVITQKQLEVKDKKGEKFEVVEITEKQLEKVRTGGAEVVLEKNLNDSKGLFGSKFRNPEAYEGDINKIEEKRLSVKKTEDEKYELSSESPKQVKWWDGLKKASSSNTIKTAAKNGELDFSEEGAWGRADQDLADPEKEGEEEDASIGALDSSGKMVGGEDIASDIGGKDVAKSVLGDPSLKMFVTKNKQMTTPQSAVYMELSFDTDLFGGDEDAIRSAALEKVLEVRPNLSGKIDESNFTQPQIGAIDSNVKLRLIGDEYLATETSDEIFLGVDHEEVDVGGTPMTVGKVTFGELAKSMSEEEIMRDVIDYIVDKTGFDIPAKSIQINMEKGEATFAYGQDAEPGDDSDSDVLIPAEEDLGEQEEQEEPEVEEVEEVEETVVEEPLVESPVETASESSVAAPVESTPATPAMPTTPASDLSGVNPQKLQRELDRLLKGRSASNELDFPIIVADVNPLKKK